MIFADIYANARFRGFEVVVKTSLLGDAKLGLMFPKNPFPVLVMGRLT